MDRYLATLVITFLVIAAGFYTNRMPSAEHTRLLERIGSDVDGFDLRRVLTMPLATIVQSSPGVRWHMVLLVAIPLGVLEFLAGSWRAGVTFALSDWISTPLTLAVIWFLARHGSGEAIRLRDVADAGSSAAAHGTIAAAALLLSPRLRALALSGTYAFVLISPLFISLDAAVAHLIATVVGTLFGLLWLRQRARANFEREYAGACERPDVILHPTSHTW